MLVTLYSHQSQVLRPLILSFRHKGLERLYLHNSHKGVPSALTGKIARILARLDTAMEPQQMNLPGWRLHRLQGNLQGYWAVWLNANRRIVFRFDGTDAADVDLIDYH